MALHLDSNVLSYLKSNFFLVQCAISRNPHLNGIHCVIQHRNVHRVPDYLELFVIMVPSPDIKTSLLVSVCHYMMNIAPKP